jgi:hypothetical protein
MSKRNAARVNTVLDNDEVSAVLRDTFYRDGSAKAPAKKKRVRKAKKKEDLHYEVICISLYKEDLERLDAMVAELKEQGHRKISRSGLIRFALDQVDLDKLPRSY